MWPATVLKSPSPRSSNFAMPTWSFLRATVSAFCAPGMVAEYWSTSYIGVRIGSVGYRLRHTCTDLPAKSSVRYIS